MSIYDVLRNELTDEQYEAAVDGAREVLTLACAGSGKSRTLAYRIARLLAEGESPENIVAFTFTEKAAETIKRRVSLALQNASIDPTVMSTMYIGTIHSYCQRVLGEMDTTYRQFDVLDENRLKLYLISRYGDLGLAAFRPHARGNSYFDVIKQVSDAWKTANDELLDFESVRREDEEIGELLISVREGLRRDQYIDFSLMIRNAVEAIRAGDPGAERAVSLLHHLMVDEYQDVNPSQEELIRRLHDRSESLFVVGDDDQSIYAWRGADVSNILGFEARYPDCSVHTLSTNFRSTEPIVNSSNSFVTAELGPSRIPKNPVASADIAPQDCRVLWFDDRDAEAGWVAERIQTLLGTSFNDNGVIRGLMPADFAILMRSTRGEEQDGSFRHSRFTAALDAMGVRYSLEAGGGPFERPQVEVLRSTFGLLRESPPDRPTVRQHFDEEVIPAYPDADFDKLIRVLTDWGQRIHRPRGSTRIRLYPQQLVYDLLDAFNIRRSDFGDEILRDIGLFSGMIQDVETVYMSVDSRHRFSEILNFLDNAAAAGYDVSTDDLLQRPDAVTVSTVHKMKGLEFPCVFIVDVEAGRFPMNRRRYAGWLPEGVMSGAIARGAYQTTSNEETRLFYTAMTRAERYLQVTGAQSLPNARRERRRSSYALRLTGRTDVSDDPQGVPAGLTATTPHRRIEDADYPTSFSEIRYYLQCPKGFQFRERYGLNPIIPEMFGYGRTVHTSIEKLHELFPDAVPSADEVEEVVGDTFHLKHVPQSNDPVNRPGAYENSQSRAVEIVKNYVEAFGDDFERERQVEAVFEISASNCVISGSIDLVLHEDEEGGILNAHIIDFKTLEGGDLSGEDDDLNWTELALQVQLYARAAEQVLGRNARTGSVHLLKDNQRVEIPIDPDAVDAALQNIEWAVSGILESDFPMRPHPQKCADCDYQVICPSNPEPFSVLVTIPPELRLPGRRQMVTAFSRFQE